MSPRPLYCSLLALAMVCAAPQSAAKTRKKTTGSEARAQHDSSETSAERERRLLRECRGRPNAGACSGYTR